MQSLVQNIPQSIFAQGNEKFRAEDYQGAISLYKGAIDQGGCNDIYWQNLVLAFSKSGNSLAADRALYGALAIYPKSQVLKLMRHQYNKYQINSRSGPMLSIIVPVYNSALYLSQCLDSILAQTFRDFELIVVNDGSTDSSGEIINFYAGKDDRIHVIENRQPSGNPGTPRNQALSVVQGVYIGFVDSDDWIDPEFFEALMNKALSECADMVFSGGFKNHLSTGTVEERKYKNSGFNDPASERYKYHDSFMIWDKIYSRKLLQAFDIFLGETKAAVDVPFILKAYYYAQRISFDDELIAYNYRRESESSVTVAHRKNSNCDFELYAYSSVQDWLLRDSISSKYRNLVYIKMVSSFLYTLKLISKDHFPAFFAKVKEKLKSIDEEMVKDFCIRQNKWWLYKEFLEVTTKDEQEVFQFFEKKKEADSKQKQGKRIECKFFVPGKNKGIMFFPAWISNNPYQKLFYDAVASRFGVRVAGFAKEALCKELLEKGRGEFDYIHLHWLHAFIDPSRTDGADEIIEVLAYAKTLGYKIIYTAHNIISHDSLHYEIELMQRKKIMKYVDIALAHGSVAKEKLVTELNVLPKKIAIVPHGTYEGYYDNSVSRSDARQTLGIEPDSFVFLFFGNIRGYKGLEPLLEEYKEVAKLYPKTTLLIAGRVMDSSASEMLEREAKNGNIIFRPGFVEDDDVQYYLNAADVCVLPYKRIVTSGAAMLCITFSCPMIAPRDGVLPEVVGNDIGMLFDDYDHMRGCMVEMVESGHARVSSAFDRYKDRFSWRRVVSALPL